MKAVLQIVHGMVEHIERYDEFARFLAERGVLVVGHSHLGHGRTALNEMELGWFGEPDGNKLLIGDIHDVREQTARQYSGVPYFFLGHSMGSFLTRQYLGLHGEGLAGAIIMGTGDIPQPVLSCAKALCVVIAKLKGWHHRSKLVNGMVTGGYEKQMGMGWLSRNEDNWEARRNDPFCNFCFTLNGFYNLFCGLSRANEREAAGLIPDIPIHFCAGSEDPVGSSGKGVKAVYRRYQKQGANTDLKLYPGMRHEILKELDRLTVFEDIHAWMKLA